MKYKLLLLFLVTSSTFMNAQVTADAGPDKLICLNDSLKVSGMGLNSGDTGTYQWKDLNTNSVVSNTGSLNLKMTSLSARQYELIVTRIFNKKTYTDRDTFVATVSPLPTFKFSGLSALCFNSTCFNLTFNIVANAAQGNDATKIAYDIPYFQRYKSPSWISGGPAGTAPYLYCPGKYINNSNVPTGGLKDSICYEYRDKNGCYNSECKQIRLDPSPVVQVNDGLYCQKAGLINLDKLAVIPFSKVGGIQSWRCIKVPTGSGVNKDSVVRFVTSPNAWLMNPGTVSEKQKTGEYLLEYCFKNPTTSCQTCDTSKITVIRLPEIKFDIILGQCDNGPLLALDSFVREKSTGQHILSGTWQCVEFGGSRNMLMSNVKNAINNSVKSQKYFDPKTGSGQYMLRFTDLASGCPSSDSISLVVNGIPQISLSKLDSMCSSSGTYQLINNYNLNDTNGKWTGEYLSKSGSFNSNGVVMGNLYSKSTRVRYTYKNPITRCTNVDSFNIMVIKRPFFKFVQTVKQHSQFLVNFDLIDSNMNLSKFKWNWDFGNGATSNEKYPREILYMDSGMFKVFLTINNNVCNTRDSITFPLSNKTSSVWGILKSISIYPNPVISELYLKVPVNGVYTLCDVSGKQLLKGQIISNETKCLDMTVLKSGIYFLSIKDREVVYNIKVVKE